MLNRIDVSSVLAALFADVRLSYTLPSWVVVCGPMSTRSLISTVNMRLFDYCLTPLFFGQPALSNILTYRSHEV